MEKLLTKQFNKWLSKQNIVQIELAKTMKEIISGNYEASLGAYLYKKRIRFARQEREWQDNHLL